MSDTGLLWVTLGYTGASRGVIVLVEFPNSACGYARLCPVTTSLSANAVDLCHTKQYAQTCTGTRLNNWKSIDWKAKHHRGGESDLDTFLFLLCYKLLPNIIFST